MQKTVILFLFIVAVVVSISTPKFDGSIPNPRKVAPAVYLYGSLALAADFLSGLPVVIAAMLTVALIWRAQSQKKSATKKPVKPPASGLTGPVGG